MRSPWLQVYQAWFTVGDGGLPVFSFGYNTSPHPAPHNSWKNVDDQTFIVTYFSQNVFSSHWLRYRRMTFMWKFVFPSTLMTVLIGRYVCDVIRCFVFQLSRVCLRGRLKWLCSLTTGDRVCIILFVTLELKFSFRFVKLSRWWEKLFYWLQLHYRHTRQSSVNQSLNSWLF